MSIDQIPIAPTTAVQQLLSPDVAWHYRVLPLKWQDDRLVLLHANGNDLSSMKEELEVHLQASLEFVEIDEHILTEALSKYYRRSRNKSGVLASSSRNADDFLESLISEAENVGSSDIHIEIYGEKARVRFRIDGLLVERYELEKINYPALVNRIKIKANLDISEKRLPQDGRIEFKDYGHDFDIRISILPTLHGEKVVLRILSRNSTQIEISKLGLSETEQKSYLEGIKRPQGMLLISGPTGSGKTTTLYATLKLLNEERRNIVTIEHPIEYTLDGVNQVQLREDIGLNFTAALKSFLRQDPDVIMLGEIRDGDTAEMAVRAALTGHLVLSTVHATSAWGIVSRLIDMGVAPYLLADTLNTAVAQRLVRKLCADCKQKKAVEEYDERVLDPIRNSCKHIYEAVGCESCYHTGYQGRQAIYEILNIDSELARYIRNKSLEVSQLLETRKIKTLSASAMELLVDGFTSLEEVYPILITTNT